MMAHRAMVRSRLESGVGVSATTRSRRDEVKIPDPWTAVAALSMTVGIVVGSPLLVAVVPVGVVAVSRLGERRRQRRRRQRADRSVIDVVERLAQQLRGGASLAAAIEATFADLGPELAPRLDPTRLALASGERLASALRRADVAGLVSLELLVSSLALLLDNGGPSVLSIDRVGETLRAGVGARAEAAAHAGQATASAALLAVLPIVFAAIVGVAEPAAASLYLTTWTGAGCLGGAGVLGSISWWWIDRTVHR